MGEKNTKLIHVKSLSQFVEYFKARLGEKFRDSNIRLYFRGESMDYGINRLVPKIYRRNVT